MGHSHYLGADIARNPTTWSKIMAKTTDCDEVASLPNSMYFQRTKTKNRSLQQGRDTTIKHRAYLLLADVGLILHKVAVISSSRYLYAMSNLSITPHGREIMLNKHQAETVLLRSNIPYLTAHHYGPSGNIDLISSLGLAGVYLQ